MKNMTPVQTPYMLWAAERRETLVGSGEVWQRSPRALEGLLQREWGEMSQHDRIWWNKQGGANQSQILSQCCMCQLIYGGRAIQRLIHSKPQLNRLVRTLT